MKSNVVKVEIKMLSSKKKLNQNSRSWHWTPQKVSRMRDLHLAFRHTIIPPIHHSLAMSPSRSRVFLDVSIDNEPAGRLAIELFNEHAPRTCEK